MTPGKLGIQVTMVGSGKHISWDLNRYFTFKLHRYTNVRDFNESLPATEKRQDIDIPMIPCPKNHENDNGWDFTAPLFCPDFKETDILKGSYYSAKYSWLRLIVHRCDPTEKVKNKYGRTVNKKCATRA